MWPELDAMDIADMWFQQVGAKCKTFNATKINLSHVTAQSLTFESNLKPLYFFIGVISIITSQRSLNSIENIMYLNEEN